MFLTQTVSRYLNRIVLANPKLDFIRAFDQGVLAFKALRADLDGTATNESMETVSAAFKRLWVALPSKLTMLTCP